MPEGDTVHKVAAVIDAELTGSRLEQVRLQGVYAAEKLAGSEVTRVEAIGKHLLVHTDYEAMVRVHLGMHGAWHRYSVGEKWKGSAHQAGVLLANSKVEMVCFQPSQVEVFSPRKQRWHPQLSRLGPDLLGPSVDFSEVVERARRLSPSTRLLGEVLLDQRIAAGIGNVYKSEVAFLGPLAGDPEKDDGGGVFRPTQGYSPWLALGEVSDQVLAGLYARARQLMLANLGGWMRTTRVDRRRSKKPRGSLCWVYERGGRPCYLCGQPLQSAHQGLAARATFWCENCQPDCRAVRVARL